MNLHALVSGAIGAINPFETVALALSTGYAIGATGARTPSYSSTTGSAQLQPLTADDLQQIDSLNIQGTKMRGYFYGAVDQIVRMLSKGGDLVYRSDGTAWKVVFVFEQWPDWCAVCLVLQNGE